MDFLREFIQRSGDDSLRNSDGSVASGTEQRVRRAVLAAMFDGRKNARTLIQNLIENATEDGLKRQVDGVTAAVGRIMKLTAREGYRGYDLREDLARAFEALLEYKRELQIDRKRYKSIDDYLDQGDMFGRDLSPNAERLARFLGNAKSIRQIRDVLNDYADHVERIDIHTDDMFGAKDEGKDSLLKRLLPGEETRTDTDGNGSVRSGTENAKTEASSFAKSSDKSDASDQSDNREKPDTGRFDQDSEPPLLSAEEDAGDFQLFAETPKEAAKRDQAIEKAEADKLERAKEEAYRNAPDLPLSGNEARLTADEAPQSGMKRPAGRETLPERQHDAESKNGEVDPYAAIRAAREGSQERVKAFMELPDGDHELGGIKFTKQGYSFQREGQKLSARGIEQSFRGVDISKKEKSDVSDRSDKTETTPEGNTRLYSLQKIPKSIEEYRQMPGHLLPQRTRFSSIKDLYDIYKREYLGQTIQTISGHRMTFKPGHFFRLIAATPEGIRKGYISKATSSSDAIRMIENGEINAEDIAGFQRQRAENIRLFKDVLTDGDFYFSEDKNHIIFGKKYDSLKHADGFIAVTLEIDDKGNLGPVSFHPRKFSDRMLQDKQIKWNIGDISSASPNDAAGKSAEKTSGFAKDTVSPSSEKVKPGSEKSPGNSASDLSDKNSDMVIKQNEITIGEAYISWREETDLEFYTDEYGDEQEREYSYILFEKIEVPESERGKGIAKRLISEAIKKVEKDYPGKDIRCSADPLDDKTDLDKLVAFYERYGFEEDEVQGGTGVFMTRKARNTSDLSVNPDSEKKPENSSDDKQYSLQNIWTGSAADYDKPSLHYVGTGEGAQVYGWGLYGSSSEDVARWYAEKDAANRKTRHRLLFDGKYYDPFWYRQKGMFDNDDLAEEKFRNTVLSDIWNRNGNIQETLEYYDQMDKDRDNHQPWEDPEEYANRKKWLIENQDKIEYRTQTRRNLYKQTFWPGKQENLLDWDKKVPQNQMAQIREGLRKSDTSDLSDSSVFTDASGQQLYNQLVTLLGSPKAASEFLYRAGIDGVTYTGGSSGVRNYVAFSDQDIQVNDHIQYSLRKRQQINPIVVNGQVRAEYADLLETFKYPVEKIPEWQDEAIRWIERQGGVLPAADQIANDTEHSKRHVATIARFLVLNSDQAVEISQEQRTSIAKKNLGAGSDWGKEGAARRWAALVMKDMDHVRALFQKLHENMSDPEKVKLRNAILDQTGVDINNLPPDLVNDKSKLDKVLRAELANRSNKFDKAYEYWINAILSAPTTHSANVIGNTANALYELGPKRFAEAAINTLAKRRDAATFGEFREMWNALDFRSAWKKAMTAFDLETLTPGGKFRENATVAIPGKLGRAIRVVLVTPNGEINSSEVYDYALLTQFVDRFDSRRYSF